MILKPVFKINITDKRFLNNPYRKDIRLVMDWIKDNGCPDLDNAVVIYNGWFGYLLSNEREPFKGAMSVADRWNGWLGKTAYKYKDMKFDMHIGYVRLNIDNHYYIARE